MDMTGLQTALHLSVSGLLLGDIMRYFVWSETLLLKV